MKVPPKTVEEWRAVLKEVAPRGKPAIINGFAATLPKLCEQYHIDTVNRQAHFLGQVCHESDHLKTTEEYASGAAYEGRRDLGNRMKGDGRRFKGRGLIQLTGRANYMSASQALGFDFVSEVRKGLMDEGFLHRASVKHF